MHPTVTIGKRLVPLEHIALVEPFDPATPLPLPSERAFQARVVLLDRDSLLTEDSLGTFPEAYGFRLLPEDGIVLNTPLVHFGVEAFSPAEGFQPRKPYRSRLVWRDLDGERQSKLLLSNPEAVLAVAVRGETPTPETVKDPVSSGTRRRRSPPPSPTLP